MYQMYGDMKYTKYANILGLRIDLFYVPVYTLYKNIY